MSQSNTVSFILAVLCGTLLTSHSLASELTLAKAEQLATENDPSIAATLARSEAFQHSGIADGQLPDPKFKLGLFNLPLDSLDVDEQPTTQLRFGVQQAFPRGNTLALKTQQAESKSAATRARADEQLRRLTRDVRETWLETWYQSTAQRIIGQNRELFAQLVDITESQYGSGRISQQDVLRAQLELARLDDRATRIRSMEERYRAGLGKWIGDAAQWPLNDTLPDLPPLPTQEQLQAALQQHPLIVVESARIMEANQGVNIAREQYKPGWSVGLEYRKRFGDDPNGDDRADMLAMMATVDIPLFTKNRQDKRVSASLLRADAAALMRDDQMRKLREILQREYSNQQRLTERQTLYDTELLSNAKANTEASLNAYQSGVSEFTSLMRARITELDTHLESLRIRVDRAKAHARLLYLADGETL